VLVSVEDWSDSDDRSESPLTLDTAGVKGREVKVMRSRLRSDNETGNNGGDDVADDDDIDNWRSNSITCISISIKILLIVRLIVSKIKTEQISTKNIFSFICGTL